MPPSESQQTPEAGQTPDATPLAIDLARALKVDLETIQPAAGAGPITELDVREAVRALAGRARSPRVAETRALGPGTDVATTVGSLHTIRRSAGVASSLRGPDRADESALTDIVLQRVGAGLLRAGSLNAHLVDREVRLFDEVHLGFSVVVGESLLLPVLRDVARADPSDLATERRRLAAAAAAGELRSWELEGATFSVFDAGLFEADSFEPVPIAPQVAVLGLGRIRERPAITSEGVTAHAETSLSLTYDARVAGDVIAARFLAELARALDEDATRER